MKKIFLYIAGGLILLAIPATVFFVGQQRDIRTRAAPATTLSLTPSTKTVNVGDTNIKLNVDITPGANQVVSADIYIAYDPTKLEATSITTGPNAPRVLNSGIIEGGTASIKVGAASKAQPITTPGTIAVLTLKAKDASALTVVNFASNTFVGGLNEPTANVLIGTTPAKITITGTGTNTSTINSASDSGTLKTGSTLNTTVTPTTTITPTLTLTPTLTPTPTATGSTQATPSALQILSPIANASLTTAVPTIQGKAPPGSTITIVIHSDAQLTVTVTADANGNWVYTPTTPLDPGPHNIIASAQMLSGATQTTSTTFVIAGAGEAGASETAIPISGNVETTIALILLGLFLIASGALIPIFAR